MCVIVLVRKSSFVGDIPGNGLNEIPPPVVDPERIHIGCGQLNLNPMLPLPQRLGQRPRQERNGVPRHGSENSRQKSRLDAPGLDEFEIIQHKRVESHPGEEAQIAFFRGRPTHLDHGHFRDIEKGRRGGISSQPLPHQS